MLDKKLSNTFSEYCLVMLIHVKYMVLLSFYSLLLN